MTQLTWELSDSFSGGNIRDVLHYKSQVISLPADVMTTVRVEVAITSMAEPGSLPVFADPPDAQARITRVGDLNLGVPIVITGWGTVFAFDSCPTYWQGFPPGRPEIEVTLWTRYTEATVTVQLFQHSRPAARASALSASR
jgi:hypothetical protein